MNDTNSVIIVGRLTRNVDRKDYQQNAKYTMYIAVNKRVKQNNAWTDKTNYFEVVMWNIGKMSDYLTKGRQIAVSGELAFDIWEKNGQKQSKVYVLGNSLQLLAPPKDGSDQNTRPAGGGKAAQTQQQQNDSLSALDDIDDIPF